MSFSTRQGVPVGIALTFVLTVGGIFQANARPAFAKKEGKKCIYCHLNPGGGARGFRGIYYKLHEHSFKGFSERTEANKAGCKPDSTGEDTRPTKTYPPNDSDSDDHSPPSRGGSSGGGHRHHGGFGRS
jgi:hypothetical protein